NPRVDPTPSPPADAGPIWTPRWAPARPTPMITGYALAVVLLAAAGVGSYAEVTAAARAGQPGLWGGPAGVTRALGVVGGSGWGWPAWRVGRPAGSTPPARGPRPPSATGKPSFGRRSTPSSTAS